MREKRKPPLIFIAIVGACILIFSFAAAGCAGEEAHSGDAVRSEYVGAAIFQVRNPAAIGREQLLDELQRLVDSTSGTYGIFIYEFDTGQSYGINEHMSFEGASTIKVAILMLLYKEVDAGNVSLDETMTYLWGDYEEGTGSIQQAGPGTTWTIGELAEKMMKESDNVAKNMLFRRLGLYAIEDYAIAMGAEDFDLINNQVTPRDMGLMLKLIYENKVVGPESTEEMLALMTDTYYEQRIPRYLNGLKVAHKIGTMGDSVSDIGIVYAGESPFVLSIYSDGTASEADAEETIARIAWLVTNYEVLRKYQATQP